MSFWTSVILCIANVPLIEYFLLNLRSKIEYSASLIVDTRKGYVALATYGRVALVLRTNRMIECDVKC